MLSKHCRPTELCGVLSGSTMFVKYPFRSFQYTKGTNIFDVVCLISLNADPRLAMEGHVAGVGHLLDISELTLLFGPRREKAGPKRGLLTQST